MFESAKERKRLLVPICRFVHEAPKKRTVVVQ